MPSLLEALERKYGAKGEVNPSIDDMPVAIFVPKRSPRLSVPTLLVLNDCDIDCAGDACALADKCADVVELDLANNKLTEWEEVSNIESLWQYIIVWLSETFTANKLAISAPLPQLWQIVPIIGYRGLLPRCYAFSP